MGSNHSFRSHLFSMVGLMWLWGPIEILFSVIAFTIFAIVRQTRRHWVWESEKKSIEQESFV